MHSFGYNKPNTANFHAPPIPPPPMPAGNEEFGFNYPPLFVSNVGLSSGSHVLDSVYEINFGCACILDALHIVPNGITPKGLRIVGKTRPEIKSRPFTMKLYVRNIENNTISPVHEWTIQGGVQWLPLPPHVQSMYTDYVAFGGDFDIMTVIIHGKKLLKHELTNKQYASLSNPLPEIKYDTLVENDVADEDENDEEYSDDDDDKTLWSRFDIDLHTNTLFTHKRLKKSQTHRPEHIISSYLDHFGGPLLESSRVGIPVLGDLIGSIFSFTVEDIKLESMASKSQEFNKLSDILEKCWIVSDHMLCFNIILI